MGMFYNQTEISSYLETTLTKIGLITLKVIRNGVLDVLDYLVIAPTSYFIISVGEENVIGLTKTFINHRLEQLGVKVVNICSMYQATQFVENHLWDTFEQKTLKTYTQKTIDLLDCIDRISTLLSENFMDDPELENNFRNKCNNEAKVIASAIVGSLDKEQLQEDIIKRLKLIGTKAN